MAKKFLLFILFFGLVDTIFISCCKDSIYDYTKINSIHIVNTDLKKEALDNSVVDKDNFRIKCIIEEEFIAHHQHTIGFTSSAYATSCENMGLYGLKNDIVNLEITCNKEIINIAPGQKLNVNDQIKAYEYGFYDDNKNERKTLAEWLSILNNGRREQSYYELFFEFQDPIITNELLKFKFLFQLSDGTNFEIETNNIEIH